MQGTPPPPIDEYVSDSTVRSDSEEPATSFAKVATLRCTRQTAGKIPASQAAAQVTKVKKRRGKQTKSAVSVDTTMKSSDVKNMDVEEHEGDMQSPKETTAPSPGRQAAETPRPTPGAQGLSTSSTPADNARSNKRLKKAPPKPCKANLRSATK
jgi:hypothetical protein